MLEAHAHVGSAIAVARRDLDFLASVHAITRQRRQSKEVRKAGAHRFELSQQLHASMVDLAHIDHGAGGDALLALDAQLTARDGRGDGGTTSARSAPSQHVQGPNIP